MSRNSHPIVKEIYESAESEILQTEIPEKTQVVKYTKDRFSNLSAHDKDIINRALKAVKKKLDDKIYLEVLDAVTKEFE